MMTLRESCQGKWRALLPQFGIAPEALTGKQGPCPVCEGKTRYRFTDQDGVGLGFCNVCGPMDGIRLVERVNGWDFKKAAEELLAVVGDAKIERPLRKADHMPLMRELWAGAGRISGTMGEEYLESRGLTAGMNMRFHPACKLQGGAPLPALLALVHCGTEVVGMSRLYLEGGCKADIEKPRKFLGTLPPGSAVRLERFTDRLGIAEGIETARAASKRFGIPTWSVLSEGGIDRFAVPDGVKELYIFGDADHSFAGQKAAYSLAHRLMTRKEPLPVTVHIPTELGKDWADVKGERHGEV